MNPSGKNKNAVTKNRESKVTAIQGMRRFAIAFCGQWFIQCMQLSHLSVQKGLFFYFNDGLNRTFLYTYVASIT